MDAQPSRHHLACTTEPGGVIMVAKSGGTAKHVVGPAAFSASNRDGSEYRNQPATTVTRYHRPHDEMVVREITRRRGGIQDLEFVARLYCERRDDGTETPVFAPGEINNMDVVGMPLYLWHVYPTSGSAIAKGYERDPRRYGVPEKGSIPVAFVVAQYTDIVSGELYIVGSANTGGMSERDTAEFRELLVHTLKDISIAYGYGKTPEEALRNAGGGAPSRTVVRRVDGLFAAPFEASFTGVGDIPGCNLMVIKASLEWAQANSTPTKLQNAHQTKMRIESVRTRQTEPSKHNITGGGIACHTAMDATPIETPVPQTDQTQTQPESTPMVTDYPDTVVDTSKQPPQDSTASPRDHEMQEAPQTQASTPTPAPATDTMQLLQLLLSQTKQQEQSKQTTQPASLQQPPQQQPQTQPQSTTPVAQQAKQPTQSTVDASKRGAGAATQSASTKQPADVTMQLPQELQDRLKAIEEYIENKERSVLESEIDEVCTSTGVPQEMMRMLLEGQTPKDARARLAAVKTMSSSRSTRAQQQSPPPQQQQRKPQQQQPAAQTPASTARLANDNLTALMSASMSQQTQQPLQRKRQFSDAPQTQRQGLPQQAQGNPEFVTPQEYETLIEQMKESAWKYPNSIYNNPEVMNQLAAFGALGNA